MIFNFGPYTVDIDIEKTREYYNSLAVRETNCNMGYKNYVAVIPHLPLEVKSFYKAIGVDIYKIREVYVNCVNRDESICYGGFYCICGNIINNNELSLHDNKTLKDGYAYALTKDYCIEFIEYENVEDSNSALTNLKIDILANLPWILNETNPYK